MRIDVLLAMLSAGYLSEQAECRRQVERMVDRTTSEVAEMIEELAQELRRATDPLHVRQLAHSIMTLAADIAVTATN